MVVFVFLLFQAASPQYNEVTEHTFEGEARFFCLTDVDGNGMKEVLIYDDAAREVVCYTCNGSFLWRVQVDYPLMTAAAEDIDDDGLQEVFLCEDVGGDIYYTYRIIRVESDGTVSWRKSIEVNIRTDFPIHFIDADGNPGKEIVAANRIILGRGLERLAFERDRIILAVAEYGGSPYFLVRCPDLTYELYTFDEEPLWQGKQCEIRDTEASTELLLCTLFFEAGVCSCLEDWTFTETAPLMKAIRLWSDIDGNGTEEAVYVTDTEVQLIDYEGNILWTWESPESIQDLKIVDITADGISELVVLTPVKGIHLPSLYVLNVTGEVYTVFALNLSGTLSVVFSDLDGDGDQDLAMFSQRGKSSLHIYTNTAVRGPLEDLESFSSLEVVSPSGFKTMFWTFYAGYGMILIITVVVIGIFLVVYRIRKSP